MTTLNLGDKAGQMTYRILEPYAGRVTNEKPSCLTEVLAATLRRLANTYRCVGLDVADLEQIGRLAIIEAEPRYTGRNGARLQWYLRCAAERAMKQAAKKARRHSDKMASDASLDDIPAREQGPTEAEQQEQQGVITQALATLSDRERGIIESLFLHARTTKQVATQLGVSQRRIVEIKNQALAKMREALSLEAY